MASSSSSGFATKSIGNPFSISPTNNTTAYDNSLSGLNNSSDTSPLTGTDPSMDMHRRSSNGGTTTTPNGPGGALDYTKRFGQNSIDQQSGGATRFQLKGSRSGNIRAAGNETELGVYSGGAHLTAGNQALAEDNEAMIDAIHEKVTKIGDYARDIGQEV